jgi:hypothetical protein
MSISLTQWQRLIDLNGECRSDNHSSIKDAARAIGIADEQLSELYDTARHNSRYADVLKDCKDRCDAVCCINKTVDCILATSGFCSSQDKIKLIADRLSPEVGRRLLGW